MSLGQFGGVTAGRENLGQLHDKNVTQFKGQCPLPAAENLRKDACTAVGAYGEVSMAFEGYSSEIQGFFAELGDNNNKQWFEANRDRYEALVMAPSVQLVAALAEPLSKLNPALNAEPKVNKSIRRIYRDTRFSKDKTPYQTRLHMIFWHGSHPNRSPGLHIVLSDEGFGWGAGHWGFEPEQLDAYREGIKADEGKAVAKAVNAATKDGLVLDAPALARVPNGFDKDARWSGWARYKGLVVKSETEAYPPEMFSADGVDYVVELAKRVQPLNRFLVEKVFA